MKYLLILIPLSLFISCNDDPIVQPDPDPEIGYPGVDQALWPYFESFEEEGLLRNTTVDLLSLGIQGRITPINEEHIAGTCQFRGSLPRLVTIDSDFWNRSGDLFKEFIVFHELGHCALLRDHDESESPRGICLSIMRSGTTDCIDRYSLNTRDYYLDELFNTPGNL